MCVENITDLQRTIEVWLQWPKSSACSMISACETIMTNKTTNERWCSLPNVHDGVQYLQMLSILKHCLTNFHVSGPQGSAAPRQEFWTSKSRLVKAKVCTSCLIADRGRQAGSLRPDTSTIALLASPVLSREQGGWCMSLLLECHVGMFFTSQGALMHVPQAFLRLQKETRVNLAS